MYSLITYINKLVNSYNSCFDFYLKELSMYISLFEIFNCLILWFVLFSIFIRFLIKRYTLKKVILFIIKRLIFSFLFFGLFTFFSSPIYCANPISKLFDTNTKKVCIATIAITGCYLSYKYVPIYYKTVISHNNYIESLKKKELYNIELKKLYEEENSQMLERIKNKKKILWEYNSDVSLFQVYLIKIDYNLKKVLKNDNFESFFKINEILEKNSHLNNIKNSTYNVNEFNTKLVLIQDNFLKSYSQINYFLKNPKEMYKINNYVIYNQNKCFQDFQNLSNFYNLKLIPIINKLTLNNSVHITSDNEIIIQKLLYQYDKLLFMCLRSSDFMFLDFSSLKNSNLLIEPFFDVVTLNVCDYNKPIEPEPINFPLENLEGFRYIGINVGYVVFYPILYSSNKILGTYNPLSSQSFMDAISNLISLIKIF